MVREQILERPCPQSLDHGIRIRGVQNLEDKLPSALWVVCARVMNFIPRPPVLLDNNPSCSHFSVGMLSHCEPLNDQAFSGGSIERSSMSPSAATAC